MKLATFEQAGQARVGIVTGKADTVFDVSAAARRDKTDSTTFALMLNLIDAGSPGLDRARALLDRYGADPSFSFPLKDVRLLAPVPEPRQMRDFLTFPLHIRQAPRGMLRLMARARGDEAAAAAAKALDEVPEVYRKRPIHYITNRFSVVGPEATVVWPRYSSVMDFELELGIFIGKTGKNIPLASASQYIFGYTIFNDFSARDTQREEMEGRLGPGKGKSFDTGNAIGPWIVTRDDLPNPQSLAMSVRVNGETWSRGNPSEMLHTFEQIIAHVSQDETLHAGEFLGSGTVGNGCGLELDRFLKDGDIVELEIEGIGVLRNRIERADG